MTAAFNFSTLQDSRLGRMITLMMLAASALVTVGCSTPALNSTSESKSAYQSCVDQLSIYGRQADCATSTTTVTTYTTPYTTYYTQYGYTYLNGKLTERDEADVMSDYIDTLDEESVKALTLQWQNLASEASLASASK